MELFRFEERLTRTSDQHFRNPHNLTLSELVNSMIAGDNYRDTRNKTLLVIMNISPLSTEPLQPTDVYVFEGGRFITRWWLRWFFFWHGPSRDEFKLKRAVVISCSDII